MCTCVCVHVCTRTAVILGRNRDWCSLDLSVCWAGVLGKPCSEPLWGLVSLQKELRVSTFQSSSESESRALVKVLSPSARLEGTEMGRHTAGGRVNPLTVQCDVGLETGRCAAADPLEETWADVPAGLWKCLLGALWQSQGSGEKHRISGKSISGKVPWQEVLRMERRAGRGDGKAVGAQSGWGFWGPRHVETPDLKRVSVAEGNTQVCPGLLRCLQEGGWDLGRGGVPRSEQAERTPALHSLGPFPALRSRL